MARTAARSAAPKSRPPVSIALRRGPHNQLGFAYQVAFVRVLGRFPQQAPLEIDGEILRFAALQLGADAETIHAYAGRQQTVSEHQQRIGEYLRLCAFDPHCKASSNNRSTVFVTSSRLDDAVVVFRGQESFCKVNIALYMYDPPGV